MPTPSEIVEITDYFSKLDMPSQIQLFDTTIRRFDQFVADQFWGLNHGTLAVKDMAYNNLLRIKTLLNG